MSVQQKRLASLILKEHYGEVVEKVGCYLVAKGPRPLRDIIRETKLSRELVQKSLCCLIQHHFVSYEVNKKNVSLYNAWISNILLRARAPRYIYCAKCLFGYSGELIVDEILQHGSVEMSKVVTKVMSHLTEENIDFDESEVKSTFADLVMSHFLQRVRTETADNTSTEDDMYSLPPGLTFQGQGVKRKRSIDDDGHPTKRQKTEAKFHQEFIDEAIVSAVIKKVDKFAGDIVKAMLQLNELNRDPLSPTTQAVSLHEISQNLTIIPKMENAQVTQYLSLLSDEKENFVSKTGERGGGMYCINMQKCIDALCQNTVESVVQERFGSRCFRIFRLLLLKKHMEQKQIGELAMISSKDAKEFLYKLFAERFIAMQEIPRTSDYAPSRTFYLFSVELPQLSRMLIEKSYQALGNLMARRQTEVQENRRLVEKEERLEATINSLKAQHGEDTSAEAIEELRELIIPAEREQLKKLKLSLAKLEQSEIQVDETIFILSQYIAGN
ncbi:DNA-directed RNA polymerase III subunit RPC3 [Acropora cervicornis]|uniref:DNA-directed RNA polymerase III subunit RPC3 n=1 Tax=Acropora cervicornis TaxID=6130 RepID=A0AAD9QKQ0_ACRCE|nr:DNA-directed RNA polymerase III subunit RPC3 [Acropora cervicornis]